MPLASSLSPTAWVGEEEAMRSHSFVRWVGMVVVLAGALGVVGCANTDDCALTATCPYELTAEDAGVDAPPEDVKTTNRCQKAADCETGFCVDGVCCDAACDGACERCDITGQEGKCGATQAGTDPDADCVGGGAGGCAGTCDGNRGCSYPGEETVCGESICNDSIHTSGVCNGAGDCVEKEIACGQYACGETSCKTACQAMFDCAVGAFCEEETCREQRELGESCASDDACKSELCEGGVCCATECAAPWSCATGACLCGGVTCDPGVGCVIWQLDGDGDGFPASSENDVVACANKKPADLNGREYYNPSTVAADCDDADANVFPGQTRFFATPRKNGGGYDYDCDGAITPRYGSLPKNHVCQACMPEPPFCRAGLGHSLHVCGLHTTLVPAAFDVDVECGTTGDLITCEVQNPLMCLQVNTMRTKTAQGCR